MEPKPGRFVMKTAACRRRVCLTLLLAVVFAAVSAGAKEKIKVEKLDDLPRFTYEIGMKPSELLTNDGAIAELSNRVRKDIEGVLDTYEIDDANTLQQYYKNLQTIAMLNGDYEAAVRYIEKIKELEPKEAKKHMMSLLGLSYVEAVEAGKDPGTDEFRAALRENMIRRLDAMPWDVVQELVQRMSAQMQMISDKLLLGIVQSQLDPAVEKAGFLSSDQATQVLHFWSGIKFAVPYKDEVGAALGDVIAAHTEEKKKDIWPERSVTFDGSEGYHTVVVGIWDSGVDTDVFGNRCWTNPAEKLDGKDTDGNGFVDDVHGIAYDLKDHKTPDLLYSMGEYASKRTELEDQIKGFMDLQAAVESPEAAEIRKTMSGLEPDEVKEFFESLSLYAHHSHGTHVAGIAAEGDPYALILCARLSFDHRTIPEPFTMEKSEAFGQSCRETVRYFQEYGVRVVNMSWGYSVKEFEHNLEVNGIGKDAEERGKMAREMFHVCSKHLYEAMKSAPEILFVAAAGNEDNDVEFDETIPSSFDLPNLLVSGAVDQAGEPTVFTSSGRTVEVYSNGFEVESVVPGGRRLKMSGTSMSSPNVTNLAAKLIARDPSLEPEQVIRLIVDGADKVGGEQKLPVINPKKSMELLENQMSRK
jgi:hypothetical protein